MTDQSLEAEADRVRVCRCATRELRLAKKLLIDVQGLFHTDDSAIRVWQKQPARTQQPTARFTQPLSRGGVQYTIPTAPTAAL